MKIAIPTQDGRLHNHFGGCHQFALIEIDAEQRHALRTETLTAPEHRHGLFPRWLQGQGVEVVIVTAFRRRALENFAQHGIEVRRGTPGSTVESLVMAYLDGHLTDAREGCNHHGHQHHHSHHHGTAH